ncbi:DUF317 domain-containing protein [Kitasatospora sp. A2-31]|uniref:DUF317 domain-containing protein n=1 Tax=Kitasatospora sp. A2-31 TaxID=2916414 RepID=UPI001EEAA661|nr:DUF317 domain-containing protein [Kitasatospora sp. A2-31]MCG6496998.1 DUF317 domain-containing protein [Kitasatospora sp. A2-31]
MTGDHISEARISGSRALAPDTLVTITPGHLAGPGDPDAGFAEFFEDCPGWQRYRPNDETSVAVHEQLTARIELDHEATTGPRWTIASYESPVGELDWRASFCARTPVEVVMAAARHLSAALNSFSANASDDLLWGRHPRREAILQAVAAGDPPWQESQPTQEFIRPDRTGGIRTQESGALHPASAVEVTLWAGPRGYADARWQAQFTRNTPSMLITAALDEVVQPLPATRLMNQVPAPNLTQVHAEARHPRRAAAAVRGRHTSPGAHALRPGSTEPAIRQAKRRP